MTKDVVLYEGLNLKFVQRPTWEQAEMIGSTLFHMKGALDWWVGDYILMVEALFPQNYTQLLPVEKSSKSYSNMRWVASRFNLSRRRENLSWSHHASVAGLEEPEQDALLTQAGCEGWTVSDTRKAVRVLKGKKEAEKKPKDVKEIVIAWLESRGFKGLANPDLNCECYIYNLMHCDGCDVRGCVAI